MRSGNGSVKYQGVGNHRHSHPSGLPAFLLMQRLANGVQHSSMRNTQILMKPARRSFNAGFQDVSLP